MSATSTYSSQDEVHIAASKGDVAALETLRSAGMDLELMDDEGSTPAHLAARHGNLDALRFLKVLYTPSNIS
jgi:ankyrin repeat protein